VRAGLIGVIAQDYEPRMGSMPSTRRATKVLDLSLRDPLSLGHDRIGTEQILLGLVRENSECGHGTSTTRCLGADGRWAAQSACHAD
jgi:hypothetical protein